MKKKPFLLIALLSVLILVTVACGNDDVGAINNRPDDTEINNRPDEAETSEAETSEAKIVTYLDANLPKQDFNGHEFKILTGNPGNDKAWWLIDADEVQGEPLNDAVYERNKKVEDVFNVNISVTVSTAFTSDVNKNVAAGDSTFDMCFGNIPDSLNLAQNHSLVDLYTVPYIDTSRDWWEAAIVRDFTVLGQLYMLTGDITPLADIRTFMLVFNKDLCTSLGLEYPYQYVMDGTWTMDMFESYVKGVNKDLNGDGIMDYEDLWGYFSQYGNSYMMFVSGGGRIVDVDARAAEQGQGIPQIVMNTPKNIDIVTKALEITIDPNAVIMADPYVTKMGTWTDASNWFASGGSLLRSGCFEPVPRDLRTMETDFGVLPYPKFDEFQEHYSSLAETSSFNVTIPITNTELERTGIIIEALAAESVSTVHKAFYDVCLTGKYVRDEDSADMLDIIFDNKNFDIGYSLNLGGYRGTIENLEKAVSTDVVSKYDSIVSSMQGTLDKYVAAFQ